MVVRLSWNAPAGGDRVALRSAYPSTVSIPTSVVVPAGQHEAEFFATIGSVKSDLTVKITATFGKSVSGDVVVHP